ncbi:MAG: hypothetical protein OQK24_00355 [Magnetovibrio sp.]|nr:hypothetical protein [Magnetovibrio sp.]
MKDIVKRLKQINDESLIMEVVNDCLDAAEEIESLRVECNKKSEALKQIKMIAAREEKISTKKKK